MPEEHPQSHSAPSSPGHSERDRPFPFTDAQPLHSPQARPRSVMVDLNAKTHYTTVAFTQDQSSKPFSRPQRKETKYVNIVHKSPVINESAEGEVRPIPRPRTQSLDRHQVTSEATYDVPPPPVPFRIESSEEPRPPGSFDDDPFRPLEPTSPKDPFLGDPFSIDQDEWNDPSAFYERPPPPRPVLHSHMLQSHMSQLSMENGSEDLKEWEKWDSEEGTPGGGGGGKSDPPSPCADEASDLTGGSTYEDATQFILEAQKRGPSKERSLEGGDREVNALFVPAGELYRGEQEDQGVEQREEPSSQGDVACATFGGEEAEEEHDLLTGSAYDYPAELSKHPYTTEEPMLHGMTYGPTGGGANPATSRQVANSDYSHTSSRHDMPLPPLPTSQSQSYGHASPRVSCKSTSPAPPLPARPPSIKQDRDDPPPLPPLNFPRKSSSSPDDPAQPRLPPRGPLKKTGTNGRPSSPPPLYESTPPMSRAGGSSIREEGIMELVALGYSRSDVVRSLAVSKNDTQLAKLILKEFGGRS